MNINFKKKVSEVPSNKFITGSNFANLSEVELVRQTSISNGGSRVKTNIHFFSLIE